MEKINLFIKKCYFFMGNKYHVQNITLSQKECADREKDFSSLTPSRDNILICICSQLDQLKSQLFFKK